MKILNRTILCLLLLISVLSVNCKPLNTDDSTEVVILNDDDVLLSENEPNLDSDILIDDLIKNRNRDENENEQNDDDDEDLKKNLEIDNLINDLYLNDNINNNNENLINDNNQIYNPFDFDSNLNKEDKFISTKRDTNGQSKIEKTLLVKHRDVMDKKTKNRRQLKRNCHLSIGTGFVCHSYSMNKHHQKNKLILESKAPGK